MIKIGDEVEMVSPMGTLNLVGTIFTITSISNGDIDIECSFGKGVISEKEFTAHFRKV